MAQQKFNITNWKDYNNAIITRGSLTFSVDKTALHSWYCEVKPSLRGRRQHYSDMAITSVLMLKRI
ncbi:MAG: IS5/IS1182 family transposase, partial [Serratia symbiotica]|nr:IS5/IS1182 family transposase [Serratia symbiotica]